MNLTLECAEYYINRGWAVLPLHKIKDGRCTCGKPDCSSPGKHPAVPNGTKDASTDPLTIKDWFGAETRNIGICAGAVSNLVILDVDPAHGGEKALSDLPAAPQTLECLTGGNGRHLYFLHPGGDVRNSAGIVGKGLDVRGHHGYVVAPPSNHITGGTYRWKLDPRGVQVAACPAWVLEGKKSGSGAVVSEEIAEGERDNALTALAGRMRRAGASEDELYEALSAFNNSRCKPPKPDTDVRRIAGSVAGYEHKKSNKIVLRDDLPTTVAVKFEELSKVRHRYNSIDGFSIYSNDQYQQVKDDKEIETYILRFLSKCVVTKSKKEGKEWTEHTEKLKKQSGGYIKDIMRALRSMKSVHILPSMKAPCSFNGALDPETTLALANGLLDLSDMRHPKMNPFTPNFYTFNYLPVEYDPTKKAPLWLGRCLSFYFTEDDPNVPDLIAQDVIHSWQKRWLLRIVNPHKICALIGKKRTGKGTIGRITCSLIGQSNVSAVTIASLAGAHGLYSLMNKQLGIMWDASVSGKFGDVTKAVEALKNISGQDNITVNPKNRDTIDLQSMPLNILMIANEPADLRDTTGALASRFTFLQTTQSFMGREDPTLEQQIIEHELSGILNLILAAPDTIVEHPKSAILSQEYTEMTSPYTAFVNECCVLDPESFIPTNLLWAYYWDWCEKYKQKVPSAQTFKVKFFSAIDGIKRLRPRLTEDEQMAIDADHRVDQRDGSSLTTNDRPVCYSGIDMKENLKGGWTSRHRSGFGQGGESQA